MFRHLLVHNLQRRILLRELINLLLIETQPRVVLGDPFGELAALVVVVLGGEFDGAAALKGVLETIAGGVARLGDVVDGFRTLGCSLVNKAAILVFIGN